MSKRASSKVTLVFAAILRLTMGEGLAIDGWFMPFNRYRTKHVGHKFYPERF